MPHFRIAVFLVLSSFAASISSAQTLDWQAVQKFKPSTWITVETQKRTQCSFQGVTDDRLLCYVDPEDWLSAFSPAFNRKRQAHLVFFRAEIRAVQIASRDESKGPLALLAGLGTGGGWDSAGNPNVFAGVKLGGTFSLDLQYDRIRGQNGFSTEGSAVIPLFRVPGPRRAERRKFLRIDAEPGLGYRAGGGLFGGYTSAKVMVMLWNPRNSSGSSPYIEFQRRFPFESPLEGDNRLTIGIALALCSQCGVE